MRDPLPAKVVLHEVVLRDGIQNEKKLVSTEEKIRLIDRLTASGLSRIEVSSFVNPGLVPQMAFSHGTRGMRSWTQAVPFQ